MVGSPHLAGVLSFCPPLKVCSFLICSYFFAVTRGKGNNPHCYAKGKAGSFWQRKVTLTKYFANHLLTNRYPRLKRRHITTLKIVCSTAQPWKALARVRAIKDFFQNCQRDNQSFKCTARGTLMKGEIKEEKWKSTVIQQKRTQKKINLSKSFIFTSLSGKKSWTFTIRAVHSATDWREARTEHDAFQLKTLRLFKEWGCHTLQGLSSSLTESLLWII